MSYDGASVGDVRSSLYQAAASTELVAGSLAEHHKVAQELPGIAQERVLGGLREVLGAVALLTDGTAKILGEQGQRLSNADAAVATLARTCEGTNNPEVHELPAQANGLKQGVEGITSGMSQMERKIDGIRSVLLSLISDAEEITGDAAAADLRIESECTNALGLSRNIRDVAERQ